MRMAVFSDVHANFEALEAVLADAKAWQCDSYFCLGDLVGYGASPHECVERVREFGCHVLKGDCDEQSAIDDSLEGFGPLAEEVLKWTRLTLPQEARKWLKELPLHLCFEGYEAVHATLDQPHRWGYIFNHEDAAACLKLQTKPVCFVGHIHQFRFHTFVPNDRPKSILSHLNEWIGRVKFGVRSLPNASLNLQPESRYLLNACSVGRPRDGDWRAGYLIYDTKMQSVVPRRVEYDIERAQARILEAGLPKRLAERLALGK